MTGQPGAQLAVGRHVGGLGAVRCQREVRRGHHRGAGETAEELACSGASPLRGVLAGLKAGYTPVILSV